MHIGTLTHNKKVEWTSCPWWMKKKGTGKLEEIHTFFEYTEGRKLTWKLCFMGMCKRDAIYLSCEPYADE